MNVSGTGSSALLQSLLSSATAPLSGLSVAGGERGASGAGAARGITAAQRSRLGRLLEQLDTLDRQLPRSARGSAAAPGSGVSGSGGASAPAAVTGATLALEAGTPARLSSTAPIGASGTSVTPRTPAWDQPWSTQLTVVGTYDGSHGEGDLTFVVEGGTGLLFQNSLRVRVRAEAPDGSTIGVLDFAKSDPANTQRPLGNGLSVSLAAPSFLGSYPQIGNATRVNLSTGGLNPDKPFDGTGSAGPDFAGGAAVTAGSFTIDGTVIDVAADDSVDAVLAKINASGAGVTASYDAASDGVTIVRDAVGGDPDIALANDTSGFLAAAGLAAAATVPGVPDPADRPLGELATFASVSSGTLTVNGRAVAIDVGTDSLRQVIDAIDAAADVDAALTDTGGGLAVELASSASALTLDDGGTGLFAALGITGSSYGTAPSAGSGGSAPSSGAGGTAGTPVDQVLKSRSYRAADALEEIGELLGTLFGDGAGGATSSLQKAIGERLLELTDGIGERRLERLGLGWLADLEGGSFRPDRQERRRLVGAIQSGDGKLEELLLGKRGSAEPGLVESLQEIVGDFLGRGAGGGEPDVRGQLVDITA